MGVVEFMPLVQFMVLVITCSFGWMVNLTTDWCLYYNEKHWNLFFKCGFDASVRLSCLKISSSVYLVIIGRFSNVHPVVYHNHCSLVPTTRYHLHPPSHPNTSQRRHGWTRIQKYDQLDNICSRKASILCPWTPLYCGNSSRGCYRGWCQSLNCIQIPEGEWQFQVPYT